MSFNTDVPSYAARNRLEPLNAYIERTGFPIAEHNSNSLAIHTVGVTRYSIPRDEGTSVPYALVFPCVPVRTTRREARSMSATAP